MSPLLQALETPGCSCLFPVGCGCHHPDRNDHPPPLSSWPFWTPGSRAQSAAWEIR